MTRQKVKLAFITNGAKRRSSCKKRKLGLKKKLKELSTLCGVAACAIVHCGELSPHTEFWPNKSAAERVVAEFRSLPQTQQTKNMVDQKKFTMKRISKVNKDLQNLLRANRQKEMAKLMFDNLARRSGLQDRGLEDLEALGRVVDRTLYDIEKRIQSLTINDPNQVGASTSNAGASTSNAGTMPGGAAED